MEKESNFVVPEVNILHETEEPSRVGSNYVHSRLAGEPRLGNPSYDNDKKLEVKDDFVSDSFAELDKFMSGYQAPKPTFRSEPHKELGGLLGKSRADAHLEETEGTEFSFVGKYNSASSHFGGVGLSDTDDPNKLVCFFVTFKFVDLFQENAAYE